MSCLVVRRKREEMPSTGIVPKGSVSERCRPALHWQLHVKEKARSADYPSFGRVEEREDNDMDKTNNKRVCENCDYFCRGYHSRHSCDLHNISIGRHSRCDDFTVDPIDGESHERRFQEEIKSLIAEVYAT